MHTSKIFRITVLITLLTASLPQSSFAWWWDGPGPMNEEQKKLHNIEKREQSISEKAEKLLSKARNLRFEGKFDSARNHAEKALRVDPDSREAKAFLDNLGAEKNGTLNIRKQ